MKKLIMVFAVLAGVRYIIIDGAIGKVVIESEANVTAIICVSIALVAILIPILTIKEK